MPVLLAITPPESIWPYIGLMAAGFLISALGHGAKSRLMVAIGVLMILLATLLFPIALQFFGDEPAPPPGDVPDYPE